MAQGAVVSGGLGMRRAMALAVTVQTVSVSRVPSRLQ